MTNPLRQFFVTILRSGSGANERPFLKKHNESNIPGLFVIGDLAGAPVIKYAMAQGYEVIEHIASLEGGNRKSGNFEYDVVIIGSGAAGLNAALQAKERGMRYVLLEKEQMANTIENFPEGKYVYAEPDSQPPKGKLWLDGATKEDLINRWKQIVRENNLNIRLGEGVKAIKKTGGIFNTKTSENSYRSNYVVLATGQRGNPRKLGVPGEGRSNVYHRLYSPRKYHDERIVVVGGGNSAIETALTLSEKNRVVLSYRGDQFSRIFKDNERKLAEAVAAGRIETILGSRVVEFGEQEVELAIGDTHEKKRLSYDHAFVLIGADVPREFLKSLGIRMENEWEGNILRAFLLTLMGFAGLWILGGAFGAAPSVGTFDFSVIPSWLGVTIWALSLAGLVRFGLNGDRFAWVGISFFVWYTVYGAKLGAGQEFWPFRDWGYRFLSFFERPWSFWYTVVYTLLVTVFGLQALKRWGLEKKDRFQIWRYISLIGFQIVFFFLIPEFLFQSAVSNQWIGERLATDPQFAEQAWRSYGIIYAWPLFFYTFFYNPHDVWVIWGILLTFVVIPIFVLFQGKRYCSWICGCGGLAETFGDRWRHLAPKGKTSIRWEWMNLAVLILASVVTVLVLLRHVSDFVADGADAGVDLYRILVDVWLVGILPVTLYPFLGGKVWCRYWCPLAKLMHLQSSFFTKVKWSRFRITSNDKCIACNECSRNCQVGIDVMSYALKQDVLDNGTSSCIGCGICVTACPMDVLSFEPPGGERQSTPAKLMSAEGKVLH